jgi:hypothetical protein
LDGQNVNFFFTGEFEELPSTLTASNIAGHEGHIDR